MEKASSTKSEPRSVPAKPKAGGSISGPRLPVIDDGDTEYFFRMFFASCGGARAATAEIGGDSVERHDLENVDEDQDFHLYLASVLGGHPPQDKIHDQKSFDVDVQNKRGDTALLMAARQDCWNIVELLLFAGANINKADPYGNTVLHICLTELREHPTKRLDMPTSPAMKAVKKSIRKRGKADVSERLLVACFLARMGADIRLRNKEGKTPLDIALSLKKPTLELLGFSAVQRCFAGSDICRCCLEAAANTCFKPCEDCFYCADCSHPMIRCLNCGTFIVERVSKCPSVTSNLKDEKVEVTEATKLMCGPRVYTMDKKRRGMCIIINNIYFESQGSDLDVQNMKSLFTALHFDVTVKTILHAGDLLLEFVLASCAEEQQHADGLVVILLSRGKEDVIYDAGGRELNIYSQVCSLFNNSNCPDLKGKPKLFFVQTCSDDYYEHGREDEFGISDTSPTAGKHSRATFSQTYNEEPEWLDMYVTYNEKPEWSDMCVVHATIPDYVARRNKPTGSRFLSAVSDVFSEHAGNMSLNGLMARVTERCGHRRQQMPRILHGLKKELYFNPGLFMRSGGLVERLNLDIYA